MTVEINSENYEEITSATGIVLVDCWASWCHNCKEFAESYRRTAARHPDHVFATLDTQEQKELRSALGIEHIPCLMVYRDGVLLLKQPGSFEEAGLDDIIAQAESLDMDTVRAELASMKNESET
jgi:thioredoxin 1